MEKLDDVAKKLGVVGPGPANYFLPSTIGHLNHDISKSRSPSFSMGVRLPGIFCDEKVKSPSPGPKYQVEYMTKYGRANLPVTTFPSIKGLRPNSSKLGSESNNKSLSDRQSTSRNPVQESPRRPSMTITDLQSKESSRINSLDCRKSVKVGDSRTLNINSELRAFCNEIQGAPVMTTRKPRVASAKKYSSFSPRTRNEGRQARL